MTVGDYGYRARQVSNDELGQLTQDFNSMANVLEGTIGELEEEVQAREDFIAAFSHELKTPLTMGFVRKVQMKNITSVLTHSITTVTCR